ncbi:hypothetical protein C2E23DRAFT_534289 [Lenzites betulinus]|nr:hypothetical protein C2E23DRAFT_534289 [Lenzites betulinus]
MRDGGCYRCFRDTQLPRWTCDERRFPGPEAFRLEGFLKHERLNPNIPDSGDGALRPPPVIKTPICPGRELIMTTLYALITPLISAPHLGRSSRPVAVAGRRSCGDGRYSNSRSSRMHHHAALRGN